jgi:ABC-type transport system involved in multi-copper enzyme maturation permease subunit
MNALPIVHRELLILSRRRWFYWLRTGVGMVIALVSCLVLAITWNLGAAQGLGAPLFRTLTVLSYCICLLAGPVLLADSVAEEKSAGTLGLLFLTNTRSHDIVGGKFVALAMPAIHCLLAAVPVMGMALLLGGVTAGEFLRTTVALVNLLFWSVSTTLLCSVFAPNGRSAFALALAVVLGAAGALPALLLTQSNLPGNHFWLAHALAGPAFALWTAPDAVFAADSSAYTTALGTSQLLGWVCLAGAVFGLPLFWREDPHAPQRPRTFRRKTAARRARTSDSLAWLARQRLDGPLTAWGLALAAAVTLELLVHASSVNGLWVAFAAYALHGVFKVWVGWAASRAFTVERDSGALELLLVTPVGETAVWRAWLAGLRRRFFLPALALGGFDLLLAWRAAVAPAQGDFQPGIFFLTLLAVVVFFLDCYTLSWTGLWNGLVARNATRACIRTLLVTLIVPGIGFINGLFAAAVAGLLTADTLAGFVLVWFVVSFGLDVLLGSRAMVRLSHDCREAVVQRTA